MKIEDCTNPSKIILAIVSLHSGKFTVNQCVSYFRGVSGKKSTQQTKHFGAGKELNKNLCERIVRHLIVQDYLSERIKTNRMGFANSYLVLGKNASQVLRQKKKVSLSSLTNK